MLVDPHRLTPTLIGHHSQGRPDESRAVQAFGPAESLVLEDVASPVAKNEILLDVHAAGVFPDTLIIEGKYQFKPPFRFRRAVKRPAWSARWAKRSTTSRSAGASWP